MKAVLTEQKKALKTKDVKLVRKPPQDGEGLTVKNMVQLLRDNGMEEYLPTPELMKSNAKLSRKWLYTLCGNLLPD